MIALHWHTHSRMPVISYSIQCAQLFQPLVSLKPRTFLRLLGLIAACLTAVPQVGFYMRKIQLYFLSKWNRVHQSLHHMVLVPQLLTPHFAFWKNEHLLS